MISKSLEETQKIAADFVEKLRSKGNSISKGSLEGTFWGATVVGLYGNLGAGKTAFTQCVARMLGVEEKVLSPTFVIMKIYELREKKFQHLIHIDAYRMDSADELAALGWQEIISDPKNLILIEWPERVSAIIPKHIKVNFEAVDSENSRKIEVLE